MLEPFGFDHNLLTLFTQQFPDYKWFFFAITQLGSPFTLALLGSFGFILGKNKLKVFSAILIIGTIFGMIVVDDIKEIVERDRPDGARAADFTVKDSYSFPSGHAFSIFLAASVLGAYYGWRSYASGYVVAIAVSLSRLYLGVHYPSDVMTGAILGIIAGEMLIYAAYRLGLCNNPGLISLVYKKSSRHESLKVEGPDRIISISIFLTILASVVLYFTSYASLAIFTITMASMFIFYYIISYRVRPGRAYLIMFGILALCLIASLSMLYLGSYLLSMVIVLVAYFAVVATTYGYKKEGTSLSPE
jgi:undecaprenyl-diphosphatase